MQVKPVPKLGTIVACDGMHYDTTCEFILRIGEAPQLQEQQQQGKASIAARSDAELMHGVEGRPGAGGSAYVYIQVCPLHASSPGAAA